MGIKENIQKIKSELPDNVILVGATKMNDCDKVREAISAGLEYCGENRVQELVAKNEQGAYEGSHLHFIGHLQKNKAKYIVGVAELIHSVDSIELLRTIGNLAVSRGITQDVLLEINIGNEPNKSGFNQDDIESVLTAASTIEGVRIRGLMTIPPICHSESEISPYFAQMEHLFVDIKSKKYDNVSMDFLSMGMSSDYTTAVKHGSNMVRVGTGIFGARDYSKI